MASHISGLLRTVFRIKEFCPARPSCVTRQSRGNSPILFDLKLHFVFEQNWTLNLEMLVTCCSGQAVPHQTFTVHVVLCTCCCYGNSCKQFCPASGELTVTSESSLLLKIISYLNRVWCTASVFTRNDQAPPCSVVMILDGFVGY